jgi:hypothetical protein
MKKLSTNLIILLLCLATSVHAAPVTHDSQSVLWIKGGEKSHRVQTAVFGFGAAAKVAKHSAQQAAKLLRFTKDNALVTPFSKIPTVAEPTAFSASQAESIAIATEKSAKASRAAARAARVAKLAKGGAISGGSGSRSRCCRWYHSNNKKSQEKQSPATCNIKKIKKV